MLTWLLLILRFHVALNWKQKKQLGLDKPQGPREYIPEGFGEFDELLKDERWQGGTFEDVPMDGVFEYTQGKINLADEPDRHRRIVNVASLYGAHKSVGPAVVPKKRQAFSHKRVFGHKGEKQAADEAN
jgi:hypothetical protein